MNTNNVSVLHGLLDELLNAHSAFLNGDIPQPVFNLRRCEVMKALAQPSEQPAKRRVYGQPAAMGSYDICSHGVVGGCLRDDPEQPAKAERPGDVGRDVVGEIIEVVDSAYLNLKRLRFSNKPDRNAKLSDFASLRPPIARILNRAALSPSVPAEAVAVVDGGLMPDDMYQRIEVQRELKHGTRLYAAPPANDEAVRLLRDVWECPAEYGLCVGELLGGRPENDDLCAEVEDLLEPPQGGSSE